MKTAFSAEEQARILRGKQILRNLWKQSNLKVQDIIDDFAQQGETLKKTTLSNWFGLNNSVRPKQEYAEHLIRLFLKQASPEELQETLDEINWLLCFQTAPESSEMLRNRLAQQIDENLGLSLQNSRQALSHQIAVLDDLLDQIEPLVMDYGKSNPVIRLEERNLKLLRELLGKEKQVHKHYENEYGEYEIPLTKIQSLEVISEIINHLNEGSRLLRAFIERHILEDGYLGQQMPRIEDFVAYCWEIADRLLHHNLLCKSVPSLRRTLLRIMATCWGIRYLVGNQTQVRSEVEFQNILLLKGKASEADIQCAVAVYMGLLARQLLKQGRQLARGLELYHKAARMLSEQHAQLATEQERLFYKKELANLCYDIASLLLWHQERDRAYQEVVQQSFKTAAQTFGEILETPNLFYEGLAEARAQHIRAFYLLSLCWSSPHLPKAVAVLNQLQAGEVLDQQFWFVQMVKASAYAILAHRCRNPYEQQEYRQLAEQNLQKARLVPSLQAQTQQELEQDYILSQTFTAVKA